MELIEWRNMEIWEKPCGMHELFIVNCKHGLVTGAGIICVCFYLCVYVCFLIGGALALSLMEAMGCVHKRHLVAYRQGVLQPTGKGVIEPSGLEINCPQA